MTTESLTPAELVSALWARALMLSRYRVRPTVSGEMQMTCAGCGECEDDASFGQVIWSTAGKQQTNYSIVELTNLASDHEAMVHGKASQNGDTSTGTEL